MEGDVGFKSTLSSLEHWRLRGNGSVMPSAAILLVVKLRLCVNLCLSGFLFLSLSPTLWCGGRLQIRKVQPEAWWLDRLTRTEWYSVNMKEECDSKDYYLSLTKQSPSLSFPAICLSVKVFIDSISVNCLNKATLSILHPLWLDLDVKIKLAELVDLSTNIVRFRWREELWDTVNGSLQNARRASRDRQWETHYSYSKMFW